MKKEKNNTEIKRREFLKKLAYTAPIITVLGVLNKPTSLHAISQIPPPPGGFPRSFGQ